MVVPHAMVLITVLILPWTCSSFTSCSSTFTSSTFDGRRKLAGHVEEAGTAAAAADVYGEGVIAKFNTFSAP